MSQNWMNAFSQSEPIVLRPNSIVLASNAVGTADERSPFGAWLYHTELFTGERLTECAVCGCNNPARHGAHIYAFAVSSQRRITPMCEEHNQQRGEMLYLKQNAPLVLERP